MLAPLLFVWPLSIVVTYHYAMSVAANPFDQALFFPSERVSSFFPQLFPVFCFDRKGG